MISNLSRQARVLICVVMLAISLPFAAQLANQSYCGDEGIWVQILGSGDLDLHNDRGAESYLVWVDQRAILLVNAGSGTAVRFDQSNADFKDLEAIVLTQTSVAQTSDLPALLVGSRRAYREEPLTILGPTGDANHLSTSEFLSRLASEEGPFPSLAPLMSVRSPNGYHLRTRDVMAKGYRKWAQFGTDEFDLSAMPVHHGTTPTLAWRIDIGDSALVFALSLSNRKGVLTEFAKDADVIVFSHTLPVGVVGPPTDKFLLPGEIGKISAEADARFIVMGGRGWRTFGRESRTRDEVEKDYDGTIIFPDDLECWGL